MKKKAALVLVLAACLLLSACVSVTEISLPRSISIEAGETAAVELTAKYNKENVSDEDAAKALAALVWASSDEAIATVESGTVTAVSAGKAQVTASDKSGKATATIEVVVTVPPQSIEAENLELQLGGVETAALEVTASPANATQTGFKYSSSDERVATVDEKGNVTAKALGECEITVTTKNNKTATATVTVKQTATGIELESSEGWIYVDGSVQLNPYTVPAKAAASTYTYKSDNEKVATVSASGAITGMAAGTAKITVSSAEGFTATYSITVQTRATTANPTVGDSAGGGTSSSQVPQDNSSNSEPAGWGTDRDGNRVPLTQEQVDGPGIPDPVPCPICGVVNGPSHWHGDVMVPGICCDYQSTGVHTCGSGGF